MPSWRDEYLSALQERDRKEKANATVIEHYTRLADRTATLQQAVSAGDSIEPHDNPTSSHKQRDRRVTRHEGPGNSSGWEDPVAKVRQDLSEAQRSRGLMEARLQNVVEELDRLKKQSSLGAKRISDLTKEKTTLAMGMRDRDEELRGKAKLLEDVHDETVSLTLQLNMAEEQSQKLLRENEELVDRWMKRKGQEADAMNDQLRFT